jgi:hypothetical protein
MESITKNRQSLETLRAMVTRAYGLIRFRPVMTGSGSLGTGCSMWLTGSVCVTAMSRC